MTTGKEFTLELLNEKLSQLLEFGSETHKEARWIQWYQEMQAILRNVFGEESSEMKAYNSLTSWGLPIVGSPEHIRQETQSRWEEIMEGARGFLEALILQIERFGMGSPEAQPPASRRYLWTSPVFLAERVFATPAIRHLIRWFKEHKIASAIGGGVSFVASVLGILKGLGVL